MQKELELEKHFSRFEISKLFSNNLSMWHIRMVVGKWKTRELNWIIFKNKEIDSACDKGEAFYIGMPHVCVFVNMVAKLRGGHRCVR